MANAQRGEVDLEIGGEPFVARFDFNAIMHLETHFGKPLADIFKSGGGVSASMIPVALWAALVTKNRAKFPTVEVLAEALDLSRLAYYSAKTAELFQAAQQIMAPERPTQAPTAPAVGA